MRPAWTAPPLRRRTVLAGLGAGLLTSRSSLAAPHAALMTRRIASSQEKLPVVGMGSWLTFDVGADSWLRRDRVEVLRKFFQAGGGLVDSSPMYGSSEEVIGHCLRQLRHPTGLFAATKVWTPSRWMGIEQMRHSRQLWALPKFDLIQVHNLWNWQDHLPSLRAQRDAGHLRYIGVTTSHGRRHDDLAQIMSSEDIDFVQFTYNLVDREAEARLLPLAMDRGLAVIINRPFRGGDLFDRVRGQTLPAWAANFDCANWAQFFLKFIISHPAVTCPIPATSRGDHMVENMAAGRGRLPDPDERKRMAAFMDRL